MYCVSYLVCFALLGFLAVDVSCITNQEFYDAVKDHITDVEHYDPADVTADNLEDEDYTITLPGDADDEVDVDYIIQKLHLVKTKGQSKGDLDTISFAEHHRVGWWHKHKKWSHCDCDKCEHGCKCCVGHEYSINLLFKKLKFKIEACCEIDLRPEHLFEVTFTVNGNDIFHHPVHLNKPFEMCWGCPIIKWFMRICLEIYDINLLDLSVCTRIAGVVDFKILEFRVHFKLGCFSIPDKETGEMLIDMVKDGNSRVPARDLADLYRAVELKLKEQRADDDVLRFEN